MSSYKEYRTQAKQKKVNTLFIILALLLSIVLLTAGLAYVASRMLMGRPLFDPITIGITQTPGKDDIIQPGAVHPKSEGVFGEQLLRSWNTMDFAEKTLNTTVHSTDAKMLALPANGRVSKEFFRTTLFIGDSLAQGMGIYHDALMDYGTVVAAYKGVSPQGIVQNATGLLPDGTSVPMLEYIQKQTPQNIYLAIGTNAMVGQTDEALLKYYSDLLDVLQQSFPGVPLYINSITPVTAQTATSRPNLNNDRIRLLNNSLALMAQTRGLYYLNLHEVLADETGCLKEDIAGYDGIHLYESGYAMWVDYLQTHTAYNAYNLQFIEEPYH